MSKRTRRNSRLDTLYARVPAIDCRGLCHESCGPVPMGAAESERMRESGIEPPDIPSMIATGCLSCPHLTAEKRCAVYELRPMICRLFGVVSQMPCPHGCVPSRVLTDLEATHLLRASLNA